jgi:L-lysine exporter family protein LysE/ArgO
MNDWISGGWIGAALSGLGISGSLIVAIGAQNAFVLRQGLKRQYVFPLATVCFLSDATLIVLGCAGLGSLVQAYPIAVQAIRWIGAAFLFWYGLRSARAAFHAQSFEAGDAAQMSLGTAIRTMLALTWLNPHVYLDTVLLLGGIAGRYPMPTRAAFAAGAASASLLWFYGLAYGARVLAPLFKRPMTWRVLDAFIALVMWTIAVSLLWPS